MKLATASLLSLALACIAASPARAAPSLEQIKAVSPALADYTENLLNDEVWEREALSPGTVASPPWRRWWRGARPRRWNARSSRRWITASNPARSPS